MKNSIHRQRGFSLLELLVAFAIMAISLGMLYRATGSSVRSVVDVDLRQRATLLAESLLASRDSVPPGGGLQQGKSGDFDWSVQSVPYGTGINATNAPSLQEVSIAISWMENGSLRQFELQTLLPERRPLVGERIK